MKSTKLVSLGFLVLIFSIVLAGCEKESSKNSSASNELSKGKIAFVTFATGIPYFEVAAAGAIKKGQELGYEVVYKGPPQADSAAESQIINDLVNQGEVKAMVVAAMDSSSIVPSLKRAREAGIKVVTWDLDSDKEGRDYYAGLMDLVLMGNEWVDSMVRTIGDEGQYAIIVATLTSQFMVDRAKNMKEYAQKKYPKLEWMALESSDVDPQKAYQISMDLMTKYPEMKCIATSATEAFSSAAKAIEDAGRIGEVYVVGGITPKLAKPAFNSGAAKEVVLWDPGKWAGFAVTVAAQLIEGKTYDTLGKANIPGFPDAELVTPDTFYYHELLTFTPENVDQFDF